MEREGERKKLKVKRQEKMGQKEKWKCGEGYLKGLGSEVNVKRSVVK
jgi:hypothetical protein